ncbi:MAG: GntR family transcriptional regulator [Lachnospiraceae bacterium]|nr:GntR family transcriptional regulator [Lachnospiraceae bacterium]
MKWNLSNNQPIYLQIMEHLRMSIVSGEYPAGSRLPSVRDLAVEASVNPNTMQRALSQLENEGLIYSNRTSGRFVTEDETVIQNTRRDLASGQIRIFYDKMHDLGYSNPEIKELMRD